MSFTPFIFADDNENGSTTEAIGAPGGFICPVYSSTDFDESWTPITNAQELSDIRNDLSGKYYLANEIDFSTDTSGYDNGGIMIPLKVEVKSGNILEITIGAAGNSLTQSQVYIGAMTSSGLTAGSIRTMVYVPSGTTETLTIGGTYNSNPFAFPLKMDNSVGVKFNGNFDSNGNFTPIGDNSTNNNNSRFTGIFDGNGYVINGMHTAVYSSYSGLFGCVSGAAEIKNVGLEGGSSVAVSTSGAYAGALVGRVFAAPSSLVAITNCYNTGPVSASSSSSSTMVDARAGGIIGDISTSSGSLSITLTITDCYNTGNVSASSLSSSIRTFAGGIIGGMTSSVAPTILTITSCYNTGNVSASYYAGGIIGSINTLSGSFSITLNITDCYNTGNVSASISTSPEDIICAGGIVGGPGVTISDITITGCYNTGNVSASSPSSYAIAGGIVGCLSTTATGILTDCYNTGNVSASSSSYAASAGGITGVSPTVHITSCYNTGNVSVSSSLSSSPSLMRITCAGGITGLSTTVTITNCYNTGDISSSSYAGGIIGNINASSSVTIINCYNTGGVSASSYAGGIVGYISTSTVAITNCYYLKGQLKNNGSVAVDRLVGYGTTVDVDIGTTDITRKISDPDQRSSAKTQEEMKPSSLSVAQSNNSIYFTGTTTPPIGSAANGWNFDEEGIWTIIEWKNSGYPILRLLADSVSDDREHVPVTGITVTGAGGATTITTDGGALQMSADVTPAGADNKSVTWSVTSGTGSATISSLGLLTAVSNGAVTVRATAQDGSGVIGTLVVTISGQTVPPTLVTGITVTGAGGATTITTDGGTLQMNADVAPTGATNKSVTWSVTNGTGTASISTSGLLTALTNGTVTVRATANDGSGVYGVLIITISNQFVEVASITVTGAGGSTTITTNGGTLQMSSSVVPSEATNKSVTWSVTNGTGTASISTSGLLTAFTNGTVTVKATANDGSGVYGERTITISNQFVEVASITVTGAGGASTITVNEGTLQMNADVAPTGATNKLVTWSVVNETGAATISSSGLLTAVSNGTVIVRATAQDGSGVIGTSVITISGQTVPPILVTGITVTGAGGATTITTDGGTLQMNASVVPSEATNKEVTWSVTSGTGSATMSSSGLLTALTNGTVTVKATANDGSGVYGERTITISNQFVEVASITVTGAGGATTITTDGGTLQMSADVTPSGATNKSVTWSVINGMGTASISTSGLLTALTNGTVTVKATANDGSDVFGGRVITISNQTVPPTLVTGIDVTGEAGASTITVNEGTLQMNADVTPSGADNKAVIWSVVNGTGVAMISGSGMLTAVNNGTVTVKATAQDGSGVIGTMVITISGQTVPVVLVTGVDVTGEAGAITITANGGTLQMSADVIPAGATNKSVTWSVTSGTGSATISSSGLLTAVSNGTVTIRASTNDGSGVYGVLTITISGQTVPETGDDTTNGNGDNNDMTLIIISVALVICVIGVSALFILRPKL